MVKVSVVIPVYNTEAELHRCIESVRKQTMQELEIICVDDGSTDSCPDILDSYSKIDSRIRVIHRENGGLVSARKAGVEAASGKYIGYVDSDDWIEPDMYAKLYKAAEENHADLVTCGYYLEGDYTTEHLDTVEEGLYCGDKMKFLRDNTIYRLESRETGLRGGLWCKLFEASLLRKIQQGIPDEISIAEDKVCLLSFVLECKSVFVLHAPLYHWVIRGTSMSHRSEQQHNDYLLKVNHVYNYLMALYKHEAFTETMRRQAEIYIVELLFLGINKRMGFQNGNMIWIDPYWLDQLPAGARIVLYGAGELGDKYRRQLCGRPDVELVAVVDRLWEKYCSDALKVLPEDSLKELVYDYIVITVKNRGQAEKIKRELTRNGVPENRIIWCEQPEVYWKYIEAENKDGFAET